MPNQKLAEKLHKPIIRKFEKCKVYYSFKDKICGFHVADMQLISKYNKETCFFIMCYWYLY